MDLAAQINLRNRLKLKKIQAESNLKRHTSAYQFLAKKGLDLGKIRQHSAKLLVSGLTGGALLLSSGKAEAQTAPLPLPKPIAQILVKEGIALTEEPQAWLTHQLNKLLPPVKDRLGYPFLEKEQEKTIGRIIEKATKIPVRASLEGEHLNTVYGYIGYEQHLKRFPSDYLALHDEFRETGIAPGLGAYGYFSSTSELTEDAVEREKWYVAVQTLYLPDWNKRWRYLWSWYRWRKVLVVNVENGNAVVAVIGDAGPAAWTGKHFGGSPEVMNALGGSRFRKGRVLVYFVDDPENKIPLGPVDYKKVSIPVIKSI